MSEIRIPCSPEQEDIIAEYLIRGQELGMVPDERAWILNQVHKVSSNTKILNADLDLVNAEWVVTLQDPVQQ